MLTPKFTVSQDADNVLLRVYMPYIRARDVDTAIADNEFRLHAKPYFLRLTLPGALAEDGRESATYDIGTGWMSITLPKLVPGEHFEDLDMLSRLLAPSTGTAASGRAPVAGAAMVQLVGGESRPSEHVSLEDIDWSVEQRLNDDADAVAMSGARYGFNKQYSGAFAPLQNERTEVVDLDVDPDRATDAERRANRLAREDVKFDPDHYIADAIDTSPFSDALKYVTYWQKQLRKRREQSPAPAPPAAAADPSDPADLLRVLETRPLEVTEVSSTAEAQAQAQPPANADFTDAEHKMLRELPYKEYLIDDVRPLYLGLVDLLFAYSYNLRATEGESTVESAWTMCRLSPMLAGLEVHASVHDALVACYRRALAYTLYRSWPLAVAVHGDVVVLLRLGRTAVLRALLAMKHAVDMSDTFHLLSQIYLTDYCVWVQQSSEAAVTSLADAVERTTVRKQDIGWPLEELDEIVAAELEADE